MSIEGAAILLKRSTSARRQWGTIGALKRATTRAWNRLTDDRHHVFEFTGALARHVAREHLSVLKSRRISDVPPEMLAALEQEEGRRIRLQFLSEFNKGAILYLGVMGGRAVTRVWLRQGHAIHRWFVDLAHADVVLYAGHTHPEYRGRGLIRALLNDALYDRLATGGRAFADCKVWNHASLRAIEAMGFERVATLPPLAPSRPAVSVYGRRGAALRCTYLVVSAVSWLASMGGRVRAGSVVLCYHGVLDTEREAFACQMRRIARRSVDFAFASEGRRASRGKPRVCVTFDDAYANLLDNALPCMRELGVIATIFVPTGHLGGRPGWRMRSDDGNRHQRIMTEAELVQIVRDGGVRVGSHAVTHRPLSDLCAFDVERELRESKTYLENLLGRPVEALALPYGVGSTEVHAIARSVGYTQIFTLARRLVPTAIPRGILGRFLVDPSMLQCEFRLTADGAYRWLGMTGGARGNRRDVRDGSEQV